jgi:hypothetical protein
VRSCIQSLGNILSQYTCNLLQVVALMLQDSVRHGTGTIATTLLAPIHFSAQRSFARSIAFRVQSRVTSS